MSTGLITVPPPRVDPTGTPVALATATTLVAATHHNKNLTNTGASATLEHQMLSAAAYQGDVVKFAATAAQIARFQPASGEAIYYNGDGVDDKYVQLAGVIGNFIEMQSNGADWIVIRANGVVTKEA